MVEGQNAQSKKPLKLVIIEDEESLRFLYVTKFRQSGFDVSVAENGAEGIHLIEEQRPDIVLLDILMPKMSGFEVLQRLKAHSNKAIREIPVVFLTNLAEDAGYAQARELGAAGYITKANRTPEELVHYVIAAVESARKHH